MKYFTKEMWLRLQNDDDTGILKDWNRARKNYQKAFMKFPEQKVVRLKSEVSQNGQGLLVFGLDGRWYRWIW